MYLATIHVTFKESVIDPQGEAVKDAAHRLGHTGVEDLKMGKYFEVILDAPENEAKEEVRALCETLLANPNTQNYTFTLTPVADAEEGDQR